MHCSADGFSFIRTFVHGHDSGEVARERRSAWSEGGVAGGMEERASYETGKMLEARDAQIILPSRRRGPRARIDT